MPTLTSLSDVKTAFPQWEKYVRLDSTETQQELDDRLTAKIEDAETRLQELLPVTEDNISEPLKRHLHVLVKKECFDIDHGGRTFEEGQKPQIIQDYEETMQMIERYRSGDLSFRDQDDEDKDIRMSGPDRQFDEWFDHDTTYPPRYPYGT
jgi:phage gp36-like protein